MAPIRFSTLPAEIHVGIAKHCENNDLINLCLTSRWVSERCLHVLYRHVDLQPDTKCFDFDALIKRQQQLVHTLLSHPGYGKHVRFWSGTLYIPNVNDCHSLGEEKFSMEGLWRALQSLAHVQSVDIAFRTIFDYNMRAPPMQFPTDLFQSATSVKLVGHMPYGLAKSILNAINPAALKHLYLIMVPDHVPIVYGERALRVMSGLLTTLTGRCTALRTLVLARIGQIEDGWQTAADEASYVEWASFIRFVRGTVESLTFEQDENWRLPFRAMDERFQRLLFPAIVSGKWPCLTDMKLRGVGGSYGKGEIAAMMMDLRALLGEDTKIVVEKEAQEFLGFRDLFSLD